MIDTDKYTGHTPAPWGIKNAPHNVTHLYGGNDTKICSIQTPDGMFAKTKGELKLSRECNTNARLIQDAPYIFQALIDERAEVKRLRAEVRRLRDMVCLLEDSRITNMSIHDRPQLVADVAEVFRQRNEDTHGHLPNFGEE